MAVFDVQNPVAGSLISQVQKNKANVRAYLEQLNQAPSITDINIARRLKELKNFNEGRINDDDDDNDDEDGPPAIPPTPAAPTSLFGSRPSGIFPTPLHTPDDDNDDDDDDTNLNATQHFLLQRPRAGGERVVEAIGQELTRTTPQRVTFSSNITRIFLQVQKVMEKTDDIAEAEDGADVSKIRMAARELNRGKEPQSLNFFSGGEKEGVERFAFARHRLRFLNEEKEKFIKYLTTLPFGPQILSKNSP